MTSQDDLDWLRTARDIQNQLNLLDRKLSDTCSVDQDIDTTVEDSLLIGVYCCIVDHSVHGDLQLNVGQVVKVTKILNDQYCFGENQTTLQRGKLPFAVVVKLAQDLLLELAGTPEDNAHSKIGELASLVESETTDNDDQGDFCTHCIVSGDNVTCIYFVWKYGGNSVSVWGSFNNWTKCIPLFYDSSSELFVAFVECTDLSQGDTCFFRFVVDDEVFDDFLNIIVEN